MNACSCPRCYGGNKTCRLCKGTGIFDGSNPATIPMLGSLGFEWSDIGSGLSDMGSNIVKSLAIEFPKIAVSTLSAVVSAKIAQKVAPAPSGGGGGGGAAPAPVAQAAQQQPQAEAVPPGQQTEIAAIPAAATGSKLPSWLLPAGIAVGGVAAVGVILMALKKKD
jgi:hypothetical protein